MVAQTAESVLPVDDALVDAAVEPEGFATCPRCHAVDATLTNVSLAAGGDWRCARCGQRWDKARIATVAAYVAWDSARRKTGPS